MNAGEVLSGIGGEGKSRVMRYACVFLVAFLVRSSCSVSTHGPSSIASLLTSAFGVARAQGPLSRAR